MPAASRRIFVFASIFFCFFLLFPVLLGFTFPPFPLVEAADGVELVSPFFVIWAYARVPGEPDRLCFALLTVLFALGTGLHLAGNSIQHLMTPGSRAFELALFFHKPFSHALITVAVLGFTTLLIRGSRSTDLASKLDGLSAFLHAFAFFCFTVSGGTAPLAMAYAASVIAWRKGRLPADPVRRFFVLSQLLYLLLCLGWLAYWRGLPDFEKVSASFL